MNEQKTYISVLQGDQVVVQEFMTRVYRWMMLGLFATALVAYYVMHTTSLFEAVFGNGAVPIIVLMVAELGIVFYLSSRIMSLSPTTASVLFFIYAALNGVTIAPILYIYTTESVSSAFFTTAAMFGAMSVYGTVTKRDLSNWGSFLMMGLIGIIVASVVNIFLKDSRTDLVISIMAVLIFTGLTAYDTNKLRNIAASSGMGKEALASYALVGALSLYLDFVNIFIYLLRIFGKRR
ncbi:MAG: Bax inhibitor-1/YccA family protein [Synergistaceae bacterium]|jgi:FtsH-binding integral membrane protein|nr:Bax inhibitor-1/YccA family protein [Synergistaceae bacterium]